MEEAARLACLHDLALDRIQRRDTFRTITRLATETLNCPVATITIVDENKIWYLGTTGCAGEDAPRAGSLCSACVEEQRAIVVDDALADPRFCEFATVTGPPHIRSYLGIPISCDQGAILGTLCIGSDQARVFEESDVDRLRSLAELVEQCIASNSKAIALNKANASLSQLNQHFRQAEKAAHIGSWRVDLASENVHWSEQVFAIHGLPTDTEISISKAVGFYEPEDRPIVQAAIERAVANGESFSFEGTIRRADGQLRRIRSMGERVDVDGKPASVTGICVDCTEEHLREAALRRAATRDPLTGLYNRSEFHRQIANHLNEARARKRKTSVTVLLLDLAGFKTFNDTLGHLVGDRLLVQIAGQLANAIDDEAVLARWAGDEFAILLPLDRSLDEAIAMGEKIVCDLTEEVRIGDRLIKVGATCGIARVGSGATGEEIMRRADLALYHGKAKAPGSVHCWSPIIESAQAFRQRAIAQLTSALNSGEAMATYQPIVNLEDGESIVAVEALLRLEDGMGQTIPATDFFPALLDPQLSRRVSRFMIERIKQEAADLLELFGPACRVGINLSEAELRDGTLVEQLEDLMAVTPLKPTNIVLEVTETMLLLDDVGEIKQLLTECDERGFTVALDDFGTGFSSLTHLRDFPIRKVKIDREFISTMLHDHQSRLIVQAMVQMGHSLGIRLVAEGVETKEQLDFLKSINCSHAQGFLFARPGTLDDLRTQHGSSVPARDAA